jgi:predicted nuclease of predicted toxin-antitoxin system
MDKDLPFKTTVHTLAEVGLLGKSDSEIMSFSFERKYLIFTQDSDFGH